MYDDVQPAQQGQFNDADQSHAAVEPYSGTSRAL